MKKLKKRAFAYPKFNQINGTHPLQQQCLDSFIFYRVREKSGGKVAAFNFDLAKEIGLIDFSHPEVLTKELEDTILQTFGLVIINEYDIKQGRTFLEDTIRPNMYMATRYLQLQHPNKQGKTSGDGRSIWNGQLRHKGKTYDLSSCGTGATCLSPAVNIHNTYFETGDQNIGYGCGLAEIDEAFESLYFSEIMHTNNIPTERVLGIISYGEDYCISIRVHENLLRPSHFFNHLKQANYKALCEITDYYITKEIDNRRWQNVPKTSEARYRYFLKQVCDTFAMMAARFEDEYIFCWLDWDGDNILMDGSIIDYGSIRQFGLYHDEYRYDDIERYSTTIKEQKLKTKYMVQTFAQGVDFLITKEKKNIKEFSKDPILKRFDDVFNDHKNRNFLNKIGLSAEWIDEFYPKNIKKIENFRKTFSYFESAKSSEGHHDVPDGITRDALFCMRDILRELPQLYLSRNENITREEFIDILKSSYAIEEDLVISSYRAKKIDHFQKSYWDMVDKLAHIFKIDRSKVLLAITMRSSIINKYDRVTGDGVSHIVALVLKNRKNLGVEGIHEFLKGLVAYQNVDPETRERNKVNPNKSKLMRDVLEIVHQYRESL